MGDFSGAEAVLAQVRSRMLATGVVVAAARKQQPADMEAARKYGLDALRDFDEFCLQRGVSLPARSWNRDLNVLETALETLSVTLEQARLRRAAYARVAEATCAVRST